MKNIFFRKTVLLLTLAVIFTVALARGAEWKSHPNLPENFRRGNLRMIFSVVHPEENFYTAGCNFYRGTPGDGYDHRKVWSMTYISPTDYFWHDRLWTEHYARGTNRPLTGTGLEFILNMDKHYPRLRTALVHNSDGTDKIIRKGQYTERKVGCRNNPLWQQYRMLDTQWQYEGSDSPGIAENEYFSKLPYRRKHPEIRSLFIDNAGVITCYCPVCKKDAAKLEKEFAAKGGDTIAAKRELDARIPAYFNHLLHQISHKYSRVMMVNYTTGCAFVNLRQAQLYPPDTICWELTYMHPPWGRCLPYYKRGLAASAGVANSAVTLDFPLPGTMGDAMPVLTPDFTRMALAEGMATQSSYILKAEIRGKFFPAARQYNRFNALFPEVYSEAEQNGRIGIVCAVRSGLYDAVSDNIYDKLTNRLTAMGIPVEVITEDELNGKLRGRFDLLIVPALEAATPEMIATLQKFSADQGGLLISRGLGTRNIHGGKTTLPGSKELIAVAEKKNSPVRLIDKFGDNLSDSALRSLIDQVMPRGLPQQFRVADANADFAVNALKKGNLESYHIVNYNYAVTPFVLPSEKGTNISVTTALKNTPYLFVYGSSRSGTGKVAVYYAGKEVATLSFTGNSYQRADISKLNLPAGKHTFEFRQITGEVALYPQNQGIVAGRRVPDSIPLHAPIVPLISPVLQLRGNNIPSYAALITPDGESKLLNIKKEANKNNITVDKINIYSVILLSNDENILKKLVQRANAEALALRSGIARDIAENMLTATEVKNCTELLLKRKSPAYPPLPAATVIEPFASEGFSAPNGYAYEAANFKSGDLSGLLIKNRREAIPPFVLLDATKAKSIMQEYRNGMPGAKVSTYCGDLYIYGQALSTCKLKITVNGKAAGSIELPPANAPSYAKLDMKSLSLKPEINRIEITPEKGIYAILTDRGASETSDLNAGAYCIKISRYIPANPSREVSLIPLTGGSWKIPGGAYNFAAFLTPENPAMIIEAANTPDSKTFILPEISSWAMVVPAANEGDLLKIAEQHDCFWWKNLAAIPRMEAAKQLKAKRGEFLKVANYSASSSHPSPRHKIDTFNKTGGKGYWIDGTPNRFPDWVEAKLVEPSQVNKVELTFPNRDNVLRNYEVQIFDEEVGNWRMVKEVKNNTATTHDIIFPATITNRVRIFIHGGAAVQNGRYSVLSSLRVGYVANPN